MGAPYQHASAVQIKHRIRSYLVGKHSGELLRTKYNIEKENTDVSLSGIVQIILTSQKLFC